MLEIENIHAKTDDTEILKGLSLTIKPGEVHAIMGPNGSGKSTLSKVVTGHPDYEITSGKIRVDGKDILDMDPDERALEGVFLAFQYPVEIPGVNNLDFLKMALNAKRKHIGLPEVQPAEFEELIQKKLDLTGMNKKFLDRELNHGFSGGEKKRNEILQLAVLNPKYAILDETDSGLDIDALRDVANAVNSLRDGTKGFLIITHYQRLLNYIVPDVVHVFHDGKIIKTGDKGLALELEEKGYDWVN